MAMNITRKILSSSLDGKAYSSKTQTQQWIVIHNNAGNSASSSAGWFNNPQNGVTSAHYCVDDSEIIQCLEDNWKGHHCGGTGNGVYYQDKWRPSNSEDCINSNSIGIEVSDWQGKDDTKLFKGIENAIDLTIMLMKKYNIDVNHVIRHGDTQAKDCPHYIMKHDKWGYFKEQLANRTGGTIIENPGGSDPSTGNPSTSDPGSGSGSGGSFGPGQSTHLDVLPNTEHQYNIANMDELKGACLIFLPPYNVCLKDELETQLKNWDGKQKYHYIIDPSYDFTEEDDILPVGAPETESERKLISDVYKVVFMGDENIVGFNTIDPKALLYFGTYHNVGNGLEQYINTVIADAPEVIILNYGLYDATYDNIDLFVRDYVNLINQLKESLPNAKIYMCRVFPGDPEAEELTTVGKLIIENVPEINSAITRISGETFTDVIDPEEFFDFGYYESDGIHLKDAFYGRWYDYIAARVLEESSTEPEDPGQIPEPASFKIMDKENEDSTPTDTPTDTPEESPTETSGPDATEDNSIEIKGGFEKVENRLLQCYGMMDNDRVTYINRALFAGKATKHNIMIACCIPSYEQLPQSWERVEANIINSVAKILWANGLTTDNLWREFDLNRAPSPAIYLDVEKWKAFLDEVDKLVQWRNDKFGTVTQTYEKYVAVIPDPIMGSGSGGGGGGGSDPGAGTPGDGTGPDIGDISDVAKAVWTFFTGAGYSKECTAGIMGNLQQESGMDPTRKQSGGGVGRGIAQWTVGSERFQGLESVAKAKGKDWTDLQSQLEFIHMELQGKAPKDNYTFTVLKKQQGSWENFAKMTDINKACKAFEDAFERAGKPMMEKRYAYAKQYYDKFAGSSAASIENSEAVFSIKAKGTLSWPCPSCKSISSKYGPRNISVPGASKNHKGIDIPCPSGTAVVAAAAGKVVIVKDGYNYGRGKYMVVDHGGGLGTLYQHLSGFVKKVGDSVSNGETIAKSGSTGVGGAHLHFEVHENFSGTVNSTQNAVNPENYVSPGTASGSIPGDGGGGGGGGTPEDGGSDPSTPGGSPGNGSDGGEYGYTGPLVNSPHGDIKNPGPCGDDANSMGGVNHDDWGGKTSYTLGEPANPNAEPPIIVNTITSDEYRIFCETYFIGEEINEDDDIELKPNFRRWWELIDLYCADQDPYDKGLATLTETGITPNDRLSAMTKKFTTQNETMFNFNVVESGPGTEKHCAKCADELNIIAVPEDLKVEPIYPDLIIPPDYSTKDYNEISKNTIPISLIDFATESRSASYTKQLSFDYDLLKDKKKETARNLGPVNFLDPYPTDDKIEELEMHYPKVFIDEIESQIYSCNHPGCPIAQPMAKNFAMLQDALINQSKRVEKRLVKLENILSTVMRNQARLGARININCVYYGGQCTFGKYKCIRCMHDDRIHDGAVVTIDQCLNCTRYEPILGQIYQILDESGLNGSIILDDMQMSYSDFQNFKRLNVATERSPLYQYAIANEDSNCKKPEKTREELWKESNKKLIEEKNKDKNLEEQDQEENEKLNNELEQQMYDDVKPLETEETKYIFRMDWTETFFNEQQPDTKIYPLDQIIARYRDNDSDIDYEEELKELDPEKDKDRIEEIQNLMLISNSNWTDTREKADTVQVNKYSSENFYFDGFAEMKAYNGGSGGTSPGDGDGSTSPGSGVGGGAECRAKMVEMAKKIVADYDAGKAKYSQSPRTTDYDKPQKSSDGKVCYDCTSFVSCCYRYAGLKSMTDKSCSGGSLMAEICNNGGEMWLVNDTGLGKAKPGDVIVKANSKVTESDMTSKKKVSCSHAMLYIGDGQYSHASSPSGGIKTETLKGSFRWTDGKHFFVRPKDLIDADAKASENISTTDDPTNKNSSSNEAENTPEVGTKSVDSINETNITSTPSSFLGTIDGHNYIAKVPKAVCSSYFGTGTGASGLGLENGKTCASHSLPYGTKIYIPALKDKLGNDGVLIVTDTGGPTFDFDIFTNKNIGKLNTDVYILAWGTGKIAPSYTWGFNYYNDTQWNKIKASWNRYKQMNGKLMSFYLFTQEDTNIKYHKRY